MKIYDTRRSNGRLLPFKVRDQHVWYTTGNMPYPDALAKIQKTVNRFKYSNLQTVFNVDSSLANYSGRNYRKYDLRNDNKLPNSLVKDNGTFYIQTQTASNKHFPPKPKSPYWIPLDYNYRGRCVIKDEGRDGKITSPYGYTYDDISDMLRNNDYHEYIQDGDYLELTVGDYIYTMRFNIDTYYDYAIRNPFTNSSYLASGSIPHHIDMLSDEVYINPTNFDRGYFSSDMVYEYVDNNPSTSRNNQLRMRETLGNSTTETNFFNFVDTKFYDSVRPLLGDLLLKHIVPKVGKGYNMDIMYQPNTEGKPIQFHKISNKYVDMIHGNLWQLSEAEIFGHTIHGFIEDVSSDIQYPTCRIYGSCKSTPRYKNSGIRRTKSNYRNYVTTTMPAKVDRSDYDISTVIVAGSGVAYKPYAKGAPGSNNASNENSFGANTYYTLNFRFM